VFVVGGTPDAGEVYHYDGTVWRRMNIPSVGRLFDVFGFGPDEVYAVGERGALIRYNGAIWSALTSGTFQDLRGIWSETVSEIWIVGGTLDATGEAVLIRFDGTTAVPQALPENDRDARALFKVRGAGGRVFAVGSNGLILEYDGTAWSQVDAGAEAIDDFYSLSGLNADRFVAVGGGVEGQVAVFDGSGWTTRKPPGVPGLNGVFFNSGNQAILGGLAGYAAALDPLTEQPGPAETTSTALSIEALWGDGAGRVYAVGGRSAAPYQGLALVRTLGDPGIVAQPPEEPPAVVASLEMGLANGEPYRALADGDEMPVYSGAQGGIHMFLSYQTSGFPTGVFLEMGQSGSFTDTGAAAIPTRTQIVRFDDIGGGVGQILDRFTVMAVSPGAADGREATLSFTVLDPSTPGRSATATVRVLMREGFCTRGPCTGYSVLSSISTAS
jgi:hypothetical protein